MFIMCLHGWLEKPCFRPKHFGSPQGSLPHAEGAKKENGRFVPLFGFANGLLAFLALAAVLDFLPVLRHRHAPAVWWGEERLLFTTRYASVRQKYGAWAFLLGVMVYEFIVVFNNSMARENWPWLQTRVSPVLDWVMYLCFGFKILLGTKYNGRSMVCAGLLYFVVRWVYFNGQNIWWLGLCVALLAAKDVPLRRVMKAFLACGVPTLALVELLHFAGIIAPDAASERNGSYRLMFGYGHPNTFGGVMFGLLLAWVLLRRARLTWPELAGVAAVGVFLMVGPKSRSAALCTFLLVLLLALAKLRTRRGLHPGSRPLAALCAATVPVLAAVSYILPLFVVKIGPWANDIGPGCIALIRAPPATHPQQNRHQRQCSQREARGVEEHRRHRIHALDLRHERKTPDQRGQQQAQHAYEFLSFHGEPA